MGPLQNEQRRAAVHALVLDAVRRGARRELGGVLPAGPGWYYPATVLSDVPEGARIMSEEPFGPVAPVLPYDDEERAVALANGTDYALSAYVFGGTRHAASVAGRLNAGSVCVNSAPGAAPDAPLGGRDASGYGYEGGVEGLLAFTRLKIRQTHG
jgi:succinate-semialdehyde dehydrogenase/glutarate-semialdehyde dehydrogenase